MKALSFALFALTAACSGATVSPLLDGGPGGDDATTGDAAPSPDGGPSCNQLLADLESARQAAVQCCATCDSEQCTQQIDGLCCPVTVTSGDSLSAKDYKKALDAVKSAGCTVSCPDLACSSKATDVCQKDGTCQQ